MILTDCEVTVMKFEERPQKNHCMFTNYNVQVSCGLHCSPQQHLSWVGLFSSKASFWFLFLFMPFKLLKLIISRAYRQPCSMHIPVPGIVYDLTRPPFNGTPYCQLLI
ncbi:hypothetical protein V6N13_065241 [Hibiscus sabdariffa]